MTSATVVPPRFWKPDTAAPDVSIDRDNAGSDIIVFNANARLNIVQQRQQLPVYAARRHLMYLVATHQTVVVVGETGSGKTTQILQYFDECGWTANGRLIACTQPRRVAAITVAQRVASEVGCALGEAVGYRVRFDDCTRRTRTRMLFLTDGMLLREMMTDPLLSRYSVIMLDEAHERSLYTDILLGLLKKVIRKRHDLRLVISSATMDAAMFRDFFQLDRSTTTTTVDVSASASAGTNDEYSPGKATILSVEGRMFPVDVQYLERAMPNYLEACVNAVLHIHRRLPPGDVLVFLTGQEEVERAVELLESEEVRSLHVLPMYAGLPSDMQLRVFRPAPRGMRKIVVCTNVAETSITIDGITYVVDCGFVKLRAYVAESGMDALIVAPVSKASAQQRAGRAGRISRGRVFRMYTEDAYEHILPFHTPPEIQRSSLAPVILQLKAIGIENILRFDWMSPPAIETLMRAMDLLYSLGALDEQGRLTVPLGANMADLPLDPQISKMLLASPAFGCTAEALSIAAMLQVQQVFLQPPNQRAASLAARSRFCVYEGDHITLLNVYKAFISRTERNRSQFCGDNFLNFKALRRAVTVRDQLVKMVRRCGVDPKVSCGSDVVAVQRCIVSAFFANAARLQPDARTYRTLRDNHTLLLHPSSVLTHEAPAQWVVFHELVLTSEEYMRDVTVIDPDWLVELAGHFYERPSLVDVGDDDIAARKKRRTNY